MTITKTMSLFILLFTNNSFGEQGENSSVIKNNTGMTYNDAYIELVLGYSTDNFYQVKQTEDEAPHISIGSFATYWLQMDGSCRDNICIFYLPQDSQSKLEPFELDLNSNQCIRGDTHERFDISAIKVDDQHWLEWRYLSQCFPLEIAWDLDLYRLKITLSYSSYADLIRQLDKTRQIDKANAKLREQSLKQTYFGPSPVTTLATRIKLEGDHRFGGEQDARIVSDTYFVHNYFSAEISYDSSEEKQLDFYQLNINDSQYGEMIQLGHTTLQSGLLNNALTLEDGFNYARLEPKNLPGDIKIERTTLPDIFIDVYVNEIYRGTVRSDSSGRYDVEEYQLAPGDTVTFQELIKPGVVSRKTVKIASLEDELLAVNEVDFQLAGDLSNGNIVKLKTEYGLTDIATVTSSYTHSYDANYLAFGLRFLPLHFTSVAIEWTPQVSSLPLQFEVLMPGNQNMSLTLNQVNLFNESEEPSVSKFNYFYSNQPFTFTVDGRKQADELTITPKMRMQVRSSDFVELLFENKRDDLGMENEVQMLYALNTRRYGSYIATHRIYEDAEPLYKLEQRFLCNDCFFPSAITTQDSTLAMSANYRGSKFTYSGLYQLNLSDYLSTVLNFSKDEVELALDVKFAARATYYKHKLNYDEVPWEKHVFSQLMGTVVDQNGDPVSGITLKVNRQRAVTDTKGRFKFDKISFGENRQLHILETSLDLNFKPVINPILFDADKGGVTEVTVQLKNSFGVDGMFYNLEQHHPWTLTFYNQTTGEIYNTVVESDGFYLIENLSTGLYTVSLDDGSERIEVSMNLNSIDWISGLDFFVDKALQRLVVGHEQAND